MRDGKSTQQQWQQRNNIVGITLQIFENQSVSRSSIWSSRCAPIKNRTLSYVSVDTNIVIITVTVLSVNGSWQVMATLILENGVNNVYLKCMQRMWQKKKNKIYDEKDEKQFTFI